MALRSHPEKNKYSQAYAAFRMIQEAKQGLEDVLRHNDTIRRNQEREEDIQHQEEAQRENELIRKAQEEAA